MRLSQILNPTLTVVTRLLDVEQSLHARTSKRKVGQRGEQDREDHCLLVSVAVY